MNTCKAFRVVILCGAALGWLAPVGGAARRIVYEVLLCEKRRLRGEIIKIDMIREI